MKGSVRFYLRAFMVTLSGLYPVLNQAAECDQARIVYLVRQAGFERLVIKYRPAIVDPADLQIDLNEQIHPLHHLQHCGLEQTKYPDGQNRHVISQSIANTGSRFGYICLEIPAVSSRYRFLSLRDNHKLYSSLYIRLKSSQLPSIQNGLDDLLWRRQCKTGLQKPAWLTAFTQPDNLPLNLSGLLADSPRSEVSHVRLLEHCLLQRSEWESRYLRFVPDDNWQLFSRQCSLPARAEDFSLQAKRQPEQSVSAADVPATVHMQSSLLELRLNNTNRADRVRFKAVRLYNLNGRRLHSFTLNCQNKICRARLFNLPAGDYLLRLRGEGKPRLLRKQ